METARALPRALMGGTTAMRAAGKKYLTDEVKESDESYARRLKRSFLFNGYGKALNDMVGKVFSKNIVLDESVPPELVEWAENVDLAGRKLDVFGRDAFKDAMTEGVSYIYTDMDAAPEGLVTLADTASRRPWLVHIKACQVLGWRAAIIGGVETLVQFRYRDDQVEYDGDFGEKSVPQIRVLTNDNGVSWATYRKPEAAVTGAEWIIHAQGRIDLSEIPIAPVYANRT